ncbi:MAG: MGMT family protein [Acidimicrobiia bacterium]|nr:MGMT family protein [Acidimicrobiia bacterium]
MGKRRRERETDEVFVSYFDTALGVAGIGYTERAIVAVQLPESTAEATRGRFGRRMKDATEIDLTDSVEYTIAGAIAGADDDDGGRFAVGRDAIARIQALLSGEDVDLDPVPVDVTNSSDFNQQVYSVVRMIGRGETLTYGEVARRVGEPGGAQAVGRAMGANPIPVIIPCHRVVGANGQLVGFSANGGVETKRRMLLAEECPAVPPTLFDQL